MTIFKKWSFSKLHSSLHSFFTVFHREMRKVSTSCLVMQHLAQPQRVRERERANWPTIPFHKRSIWLGFSGHGISQYTGQQKVERETQTHLYITLNMFLYFAYNKLVNQCKIVKIQINQILVLSYYHTAHTTHPLLLNEENPSHLSFFHW